MQDDHQLRYSYRLQPTIIWWNLTRLGEALGELMGSMSHVDEPTYISGEYSDDQKAEVVKHGERIIEAVGEDYKILFLEEYKALMAKVLALRCLIVATRAVKSGRRHGFLFRGFIDVGGHVL
jgi:uncharacterized protein YdiU (UPF0061 family)